DGVGNRSGRFASPEFHLAGVCSCRFSHILADCQRLRLQCQLHRSAWLQLPSNNVCQREPTHSDRRRHHRRPPSLGMDIGAQSCPRRRLLDDSAAKLLSGRQSGYQSHPIRPFTRKAYATIPSTATQIAGNSVVAVDPFTGSLGSPVNVGSEPNFVAETADGRYLYITLDGAQSLTSLDLTTSTLGPAYPIVPPGMSQMAATDMAVSPSPDSLLAIGLQGGQFGLFDATGSSGSFRPNIPFAYVGPNLKFWNENYLFSLDTNTSGGEFFRWAVTSNGPVPVE